MQTPNCFTQVTLPDTSPLIIYSPPDAWTGSYSSSSEATWQPGLVGGGASVHAASAAGATASFEYPGTSSEITGQLTDGAGLTYTSDGAQRSIDTRTSSDGVSSWSAASGVQDVGVHTAAVKVTGGQDAFLVGVKGVNTVVGLIAETTDPSLLSCHETLFVDALMSTQPQILPSGPWRAFQTFGGVGGQNTLDYPSIIANSTASVKLFPPLGSNFVSLNGTVGYTYGQYTVSFDPPLPDLFARKTNTFNATARWAAPGQLLYYAPLDPRKQYTVTVTGDADASRDLGLHSWMYCDYALAKNGGGGGGSSNTGGGSKTNVGAIAGGVVGGVAALALALAAFLFLRRRRRTRSPEEELFTVDDTIDTTATPYEPPTTVGARTASPTSATPPHDPHSGSVSPPSAPSEAHMSERQRESSGALAPLLASMKARESVATSSSGRVLVEHQDAGALPLPGEPEEHLPPTYNPDWLAARSATSPSSASGEGSDRSRSETPAPSGRAGGAPFRPPVVKSAGY